MYIIIFIYILKKRGKYKHIVQNSNSDFQFNAVFPIRTGIYYKFHLYKVLALDRLFLVKN